MQRIGVSTTLIAALLVIGAPTATLPDAAADTAGNIELTPASYSWTQN
jgi:hypothetical protein